MRFREANRRYEEWLERQTVVLPEDLRLKHARMREGLFPFLRATYFRWAQVWREVCGKDAAGPKVLAVGDLHVENFGTWRDVDGRPVWGVNDFDEVHPLPFANDLIRLAVSAYLAIGEGELSFAPKLASQAILEGYEAALRAGGCPFVLADSSTPLREMARKRLDTPERFWNKLRRFAPLRKPPPTEVMRLIRELLPEKNLPLHFVHRIAGLGSLGKQRFTAVGVWAGGQIAREAKALTPSACLWAEGKPEAEEVRYEEILRRAVRCPDPLVAVRGKWLLRRLSPDCFRIVLADLPRVRDDRELLYSMGWETANVHLGSGKAVDIRKDLKRRKANWLHRAAKAMREEVFRDWNEFRG